MRILISLMYYRPHYSGLTIYTERLARALARKGHQVTVLTARYLPQLPRWEVKDGVTIVRPRVVMRLSKGVIMPSMPLWAWRLVGQADVVNAHVPQPDAAIIALFSRLRRKPIVLTYHSDLRLPAGLIHFLANQYAHLTNHLSAFLANVIVTNTRDFAEHSPFLRHYLSKVRAIFPPIELAPVSEEAMADFRDKHGLPPEARVIGMFARLATEKGVEYLVQALPQVLEKHPDVRVLFAGQHQNVLGEEKYAQKLAPLIEQLGEHWAFLGNLPPEEQTAFYRTAAVTVLPSINSTESFGMVQVESMVCGTPVIATNLPGVRQPVSITGMGKIVPPRDAPALAQALIGLLDEPNGYGGRPEGVAQQFASDTIATQYEEVFKELLKL
jgi:glycosyltransferase involved in cell wall biosynthesis